LKLHTWENMLGDVEILQFSPQHCPELDRINKANRKKHFAERYKDPNEEDEYDAKARHLAIKLNGKHVGGGRIIGPMPLYELPMAREDIRRGKPFWIDDDGGGWVELSRFYLNHQSPLLLRDTLFALENIHRNEGHKRAVASFCEDLHTLAQLFKMKITPIGEDQYRDEHRFIPARIDIRRHNYLRKEQYRVAALAEAA
jgi:hypothetical protein